MHQMLTIMLMKALLSTYREFSEKDTSSTEQKLCPLIPKTIENIRHG
jgi:hypothetical protein